MSTVSSEDLITVITSDKREPAEEELDSFKNLVNDWFKYDDQIRKLSTAIKERKTYQKALNTKIQDFMFTYNYNDLHTEHGRIKTNIREVKEPVKIADIKEKIIKYKSLSGEELLNQIFNEERKTVVKRETRRIFQEVSLSL
jgi:hypothetical protein